MERLQKILARAGLGSRRQCEELILQGRVTVDDRVVRELGSKADPETQEIRVDGERIRPEKPVYFLFYKPKGVLCTNYDPSGRLRVVDFFTGVAQRVFPVGRLDRASEGLMIVTNDGEFANLLTHPRHGVPKTYVVQVAGEPSDEDLKKLTKGIWLSDGRVRADQVRRLKRQGKSRWLEIVLSQGRNRQIRRMLARLGHKVMKLKRTKIGPISDPSLKPGQYRPLRPDELQALREAAAARRKAASRRNRPRAKAAR